MNDSFLRIRYVKLYFTIQFTEKTTLPKNKASALRGGMGEMLLRTNCIRDRQCENCDFENECLIRRIMYSKMEIQPKFMTEGDSVGYVLECEDYKEQFDAGDLLKFQLILFGKTIVYFGQILDAFFRLGVYGLGKYHGCYQIIEIKNSSLRPILQGNDIRMEQYEVHTLEDYVQYRQSKISYQRSVIIRFFSPFSVKYQGQLLNDFQAEAIVSALRRRLYMLCCFEGIELTPNEIYQGTIPELINQGSRRVIVPRFSYRKNEKMQLWGLEGSLKLEDVEEALYLLLLAGELIHIGKNTSFGFGRYRMSEKASIK